MNEQLIAQVEELGLSNKEARVYVANLMIGPSGVQQIADASGIKRVTTYVILESLVSLGLVSQSNQGKKTLFNAESPENLRRLLEKKEESLKEQKVQLDELLPELNNLTSIPKDAPKMKFYDGVESVLSITKLFAEIVAKEEVGEICGISNLDKVYAFFPEIEENQSNPVRTEAGVRSKFLYTTSRGPIMRETDKQKNRISRFVPIDKYNFNCDISIAGDYVALLSLDQPRPIGITIESKSISDGMRTVFELAWEAASKYQ